MKCRLWALAAAALLGAQLHAQLAERRVVLISGEFEYSSRETLTRLAKQLARAPELKVTVLSRTTGDSIPGLEAVRSADLLITFIRRMTLPPEQIGIFRDYFRSGRPIVALRATCHAFQNWPEFDREVLGGNYHAHYSPEQLATVHRVEDERDDPLLAGVAPSFPYGTQLYLVSPVANDVEVLLTASLNADPAKTEPVAWTRAHRGGRIFFTSLGAQNDFSGQPFITLVGNAIGWTLADPSLPKRLALAPIDHLPALPLTPDEFAQYRTLNTYTFLDLRPAAAFARGHQRKAVNLDPAGPDFARRCAALDPLRNTAVLGPTGEAARALAERLHERGFAVVYYLNAPAPTS